MVCSIPQPMALGLQDRQVAHLVLVRAMRMRTRQISNGETTMNKDLEALLRELVEVDGENWKVPVPLLLGGRVGRDAVVGNAAKGHWFYIEDNKLHGWEAAGWCMDQMAECSNPNLFRTVVDGPHSWRCVLPGGAARGAWGDGATAPEAILRAYVNWKRAAQPGEVERT